MISKLTFDLPESKPLKIVESFIVCFLGSILLALCGKIKVYLPFTPVPLVLQMQAIFLLSCCLGTKKTAGVIALTIVQGFAGVSIFQDMMNATLTMGYIFGYALAALFLAKTSSKESEVKRLVLLEIASFIIYFCGAFWLSSFIGIKSAIYVGVFPFVIFDLLKNFAVVKTVSFLRKNR